MKLRHMPAACRHSPGFVLQHGRAMLAHTFAGIDAGGRRSGSEDERAVFDRFREHRRREREAATSVELPDYGAYAPAALKSPALTIDS